jgi:hypothetical protein
MRATGTRTLREAMTAMLTDRGLFDGEAAEVLGRYLADPAHESMRGRLDDPVDAYPPGLERAVWLAVRWAALVWIDETRPAAWFRPMFADE